MRLVVRRAEVDGRLCDVAVSGCHTVLLDGNHLDAGAKPVVLDARGGALLPGLHDHHLHLLAMAVESTDCSTAADAAELGSLLRRTPGSWVRAVGYHESIAGELDRHTLDRLVADRPVRLQHRSGALWMLNSAALSEVAAVLDDSEDVERDEAGVPTGLLWRYDSRLRPALPPREPDLAAVGTRLLGLGITGVTDATPDLDPSAVSLLAKAHHSHALPQDLVLLGVPDDFTGSPGVRPGPAKLLLRDHDLPDVDTVTAWVTARHDAGRPVAVHCVTSDALAIVLAAFEAAGALPGDRLEHAAVVPSGLRGEIARLGLRVVTNPAFLDTRGDTYAQDVAAAELPFLYPFGSLLRAGIRVAAASDAPYGDVDPWQVMRSARDRMSRTGRPLAPEESVETRTALAGYLSPASAPGDEPQALSAGRYGGLCLLRAPLAPSLSAPDASLVRLVAVGGTIESMAPARPHPEVARVQAMSSLRPPT